MRRMNEIDIVRQDVDGAVVVQHMDLMSNRCGTALKKHDFSSTSS